MARGKPRGALYLNRRSTLPPRGRTPPYGELRNSWWVHRPRRCRVILSGAAMCFGDRTYCVGKQCALGQRCHGRRTVDALRSHAGFEIEPSHHCLRFQVVISGHNVPTPPPRVCRGFLEDYVASVNDVFGSPQRDQCFRTKQAVRVGDDADQDWGSQFLSVRLVFISWFISACDGALAI